MEQETDLTLWYIPWKSTRFSSCYYVQTNWF